VSVEGRLKDTLAAFDAVEPAPDLFSRVERSVADDLTRRRRVGRWVASIIGSLSVAVLVVASLSSRAPDGTIVIPGWPAVAVETALLIGVVLAFGPLIRRFGSVFIDDVFEGSSDGVGSAFLRLLDVAYYLVFAGYIVLTVPVADLAGRPSLRSLLDVAADRFGGLLLLMGIMHAATIAVLPLIGLIHASTVREQQRSAMPAPPPSTPGAALAERVVRIVLWSAGGVAGLLLAAVVLNIVLSVLLGFDG
jgi:hypothetical protein